MLISLWFCSSLVRIYILIFAVIGNNTTNDSEIFQEFTVSAVAIVIAVRALSENFE